MGKEDRRVGPFSPHNFRAREWIIRTNELIRQRWKKVSEPRTRSEQRQQEHPREEISPEEQALRKEVFQKMASLIASDGFRQDWTPNMGRPYQAFEVDVRTPDNLPYSVMMRTEQMPDHNVVDIGVYGDMRQAYKEGIDRVPGFNLTGYTVRADSTLAGAVGGVSSDFFVEDLVTGEDPLTPQERMVLMRNLLGAEVDTERTQASFKNHEEEARVRNSRGEFRTPQPAPQWMSPRSLPLQNLPEV